MPELKFFSPESWAVSILAILLTGLTTGSYDVNPKLKDSFSGALCPISLLGDSDATSGWVAGFLKVVKLLKKSFSTESSTLKFPRMPSYLIVPETLSSGDGFNANFYWDLTGALYVTTSLNGEP